MFLNTLKLLVILNSFIASSVIWAKEIQAMSWVKLKTETEKSSKVCKDLKIACSDDPTMWKLKGSADTKLYLTDDTPQLFEIEKVNQSYKIINHWSFKSYQHHSQNSSDDELGDFGTQIFPAFYPINQQKQAIALVKHWGTGYSGGGKGEQIADFIMLEPHGKFKVALTTIPFYSYEMIRACFTESEYNRSPHCHDESGSSLSIQFKNIGKPFYQWTLNYTNFEWAAFKPEKTKRVTKSKVVVMPFVKN